MQNPQRRHPPKIAPEWLVWRKSPNGSLWYWGGNEHWVERRADAHGFLSPAEAQVVATGHAATVASK